MKRRYNLPPSLKLIKLTYMQKTSYYLLLYIITLYALFFRYSTIKLSTTSNNGNNLRGPTRLTRVPANGNNTGAVTFRQSTCCHILDDNINHYHFQCCLILVLVVCIKHRDMIHNL